MHTVINFSIRNSLPLVLLAIVAGCTKNKRCNHSNEPNFIFAVTGKWTPEKEIYQQGDTLFFKSSFPKTLADQVNPGLNIDFSNSFGITGNMTIVYLDTVSKQAIPARDSFICVGITGTFQERTNNPSSGIYFSYKETSAEYNFEGALVCKKKGIYSFSIATISSAGTNSKPCEWHGFDLTLTNIEKNLYLHNYALGIPPTDPLLIKRAYDFRVQ